ncbi:MAG: hypothetical protein MK033_12835 [Candidatus Caenarcaniphilales bacterium]|nr:hypothetical protein [Candidatus Caenarcaniphilales bacterium]
MNKIIKSSFLVYGLFVLSGCIDKEESQGRIAEKKEDEAIRLVKSIDTVNNIYEYNYLDINGHKQGRCFSLLGNTLDTFQTYTFYNDTLLNYVCRYKNNHISEIRSYRFNKGEYLLQDWTDFDSLGNISKENSCYVNWNYNLSKIINIGSSSINLKGELICEGRGVDEIKVAYSMDGIQSDTIYYEVNEPSKLNIELEKGMNRIKLFYSSKSFVEQIGEEAWLDREYLVFVNRK